jgi:predicted Na+-dependent transporter
MLREREEAETMLHTIAEFLVKNVIELVMFSVGLRTPLEQVLVEVRRSALLVRPLIVFALGVPLLTLVVVRLLDVPPWTTIVFILFGISPGAPTILGAFQRRQTAAAKALAIVAVVLAASTFIVPVWLVILNRFLRLGLRSSPIGIFGLLLVRVFGPLLVGIAMRRCAPRVAAVIDRVLLFPIIVGLVITVVLLLQLGREVLPLITVRIVIALLLVTFGSAALGDIAGGDDLELREIFGRLAMTGNAALALAIFGTSYPELELGGLVAAYLVARAIASIPYTVFAKRRFARRHAEQPS